MKKETNLTLGVSEPQKVTEYLQNFEHPLIEIVHYLRKIILETDANIGEGIYWNAPTFYFTGKMESFLAKEYKRYIVGFVFNKKDCIRLVFLNGKMAIDDSNLLEGNFTDNRKLAVFSSIEDVKTKEKNLKDIIKQLINQMK